MPDGAKTEQSLLRWLFCSARSEAVVAMKLIDRVISVLGFPAAYRLFFWVVGGDVRKIYTAEYVKAVPGEKVLDIGCGPGDILDYLPGVRYTGFDLSPEYIEAAQKRFGAKGRFFCSDVGLTAIEEEQGTFDLVLATGVLHHLDDQRAAKLIALAARALRPGGRFVTCDGCYVPEQTRLARWMLRRDRGKFVRPKAEFVKLASQHFAKVETFVRHDLVRIPYTALIMQCAN